jgi:hypothetical protein
MWWLSAKSFVNIFFNIFFADKVFQIAFGYLGSCVSKRYFGQSKWTVDYIGSILIWLSDQVRQKSRLPWPVDFVNTCILVRYLGTLSHLNISILNASKLVKHFSRSCQLATGIYWRMYFCIINFSRLRFSVTRLGEISPFGIIYLNFWFFSKSWNFLTPVELFWP